MNQRMNQENDCLDSENKQIAIFLTGIRKGAILQAPFLREVGSWQPQSHPVSGTCCKSRYLLGTFAKTKIKADRTMQACTPSPCHLGTFPSSNNQKAG